MVKVHTVVEHNITGTKQIWSQCTLQLIRSFCFLNCTLLLKQVNRLFSFVIFVCELKTVVNWMCRLGNEGYCFLGYDAL